MADTNNPAGQRPHSPTFGSQKASRCDARNSRDGDAPENPSHAEPDIENEIATTQHTKCCEDSAQASVASGRDQLRKSKQAWDYSVALKELIRMSELLDDGYLNHAARERQELQDEVNTLEKEYREVCGDRI